MARSVLEKKSSFNMLVLTFSSKLDLGLYIITKTTSKKIGALICSMKFLFPKVTLCLHKSTAWNIVPMSGLVLLVTTCNC